MDTPAAIIVDGKQIFDFLITAFWVFLRVGSALVAAPLIGGMSVPRRIRLVLAVGLSIAMTPLLNTPQIPELFSSAWFISVAREIVFGIAIGLMLHIAFEAFSVASELMAQGMGLSFAQMTNPLTGSAGALLTQLMIVLGGLLFFSADLHLTLIELLAHSLKVIPAASSFNVLTLTPVMLELLGQALLVGVKIALPVMVAMLLINMTFGVLSRTAPALNPLAVGFPATLLCGILLLMIVLPKISAPFLDFVRSVFQALLQWMP